MTKVADLDATYRSLKSLLVEFESPRPGIVLEGRGTTDRDFDLWSVRKPADGTSRDEVFFAGIRLQKECVGFYCLPVYTDPEVGAALGAGLKKLQKGKSCFQVRSLDGGLLDQIRHALNRGLEAYRKQGRV